MEVQKPCFFECVGDDCDVVGIATVVFSKRNDGEEDVLERVGRQFFQQDVCLSGGKGVEVTLGLTEGGMRGICWTSREDQRNRVRRSVFEGEGFVHVLDECLVFTRTCGCAALEGLESPVALLERRERGTMVNSVAADDDKMLCHGGEGEWQRSNTCGEHYRLPTRRSTI